MEAPARSTLLVAVGVLAVLLVAAAALARTASGPADRWTVASPDGSVTATVAARANHFVLTVRRRGRRVLDTPLGTADARRLAIATGTVRDAFTTPAGKRLRHELDAHRLTLSFGPRRRIEVLAADDGVALRQTGAGAESTAWRPPPGTRAWLQSFRASYEGHYDPVALDAARAGDYGFPALLDTGAGTWALLTEAGLTRGAAARLTIAAGRRGTLGVALPRGEAPPDTTPWRVAVVGDLPAIVASDLALSLGRPSQIRDTSWIHPGRVAWSWWSEPASPGDARRQRAYVRAAAAYGWPYVLLDAGWWNVRDMPGLARYAAARGVRIMLW
ncbi:MAG: hypothetical protein QOF17_214, partial [Solirubrobacteraceae bacterium]|nr:hypothetical protein [Solirubrobacteraceae bacterium]